MGSGTPVGMDESGALASLTRIVLDVRLVVLLLVVLTAEHPAAAAWTITLMAVTSLVPVLTWDRIGAWVLRHPLIMTVDLAVSVVVLLTAGPESPFGLFAVTTAVLVGVLYDRAGGLALSAPLVLASGWTALTGDPGPDLVTGVVLPALLVTGAWAGGELRRLLLERRAALREVRRSLVRAATAEERERLARELHDSVAKTLQGLALSATNLPMLAARDPERAADEAGRIRRAAERAADEARRLLRDLRVDDLDRPFEVTVREVVSAWNGQGGPATELRVRPLGELAPRVRYELLQILRESLRNAVRHADASRIVIDLGRDGDVVHLSIDDDGCGFAGAADLDALSRAGHFGLVGLHERAAALDGHVRIRSTPGCGTRVEVRAPAGTEVEA